ncbi:IclR family transcriptional regulator domain-containing protein [Paenibacillus hemerocallicola]
MKIIFRGRSRRCGNTRHYLPEGDDFLKQNRKPPRTHRNGIIKHQIAGDDSILSFELGAVYTNSTDLTVERKKILIELVERTGLTTHLAVLDKDAVLYLVHVEPDHRQYLSGAVGQRGAIYHTALGKSLTAWLPREKVAALLATCSFEKKTDRTIDSLERFLEQL